MRLPGETLGPRRKLCVFGATCLPISLHRRPAFEARASDHFAAVPRPDGALLLEAGTGFPALAAAAATAPRPSGCKVTDVARSSVWLNHGASVIRV